MRACASASAGQRSSSCSSRAACASTSGMTTASFGSRDASAWRSLVTLDSHERGLADSVRPAAEMLECVGVGSQLRPLGVEGIPGLAARQATSALLFASALGPLLVEPQRLGIEAHRIDVLGGPAADETGANVGHDGGGIPQQRVAVAAAARGELHDDVAVHPDARWPVDVLEDVVAADGARGRKLNGVGR